MERFTQRQEATRTEQAADHGMTIAEIADRLREMAEAPTLRVREIKELIGKAQTAMQAELDEAHANIELLQRMQTELEQK